MKEVVKVIGRHKILYRCTQTGIAWVEDGSTGMSHSAHPNIDSTGSVSGMKKLGYWGQNDRTVRTGGTIYNISRCAVTDPLDEIARQYCRCGGNHGCVYKHDSQEVSNEMRAMYAKRALEIPPYDEDPECALVDLLANLMHYCDQRGIEFEEELQKAREHFKAER